MTTPYPTPENVHDFYVCTRTRLKDKRAHPYLAQYWPDAVRADQMSRDQLLELKQERLEKLVRHVTQHVPFYQRWAQKTGYQPGDPIEITDLPIVTKDHYRKSLDDFQSDAYPLSEMGLGKTSGSSGEPFRFRGHLSVADHSYACLWRNLARFGLRPGQKRAYVWGRSWSFTATGLRAIPVKAKLRFRNWLNNTKQFDAYSLSSSNVAQAVDRLIRFKPEYMHGFGSAMYAMARHVLDQNNKCPPLKLKAVVTESEKIYDFQREAMARAFHCPVVEVYGSVEFGSMACEDPQGHLRINEDMYHMEQDEHGTAVITNMLGYAFPFIRYKLGDMIELETDIPPGLPYRVLKRVIGRTVDMVPLAQGGYVHGASISDSFHPHVDYILKYQVHQKAINDFAVKLVPKTTIPQHILNNITHNIRELVGHEAMIEIKIVDDIPPAASGKFRLVTSDISDIAQQVTQSDQHLQSAH
ncbi:MAG: phenylacetate--CoA ligase family protein [Phycisphaerales bacterium JB063]